MGTSCLMYQRPPGPLGALILRMVFSGVFSHGYVYVCIYICIIAWPLTPLCKSVQSPRKKRAHRTRHQNNAKLYSTWFFGPFADERSVGSNSAFASVSVFICAHKLSQEFYRHLGHLIASVKSTWSILTIPLCLVPFVMASRTRV